MNMPKLLIIGAPRCGTSTLFHMLCQVSGIWGKHKEIHFFNRHWKKGPHWYRRQFDGAPEDSMSIEATPAYFFTPVAPQRIKDTLPGVKLVLLLRDPVARCLSHYWPYQDKFGTDPRVLMDANHHCVVHGQYADHLRHWARVFPRRQMLIFASEAFFAEPAVYAYHLATWAGIPHQVAYSTRFKATHYDPLTARKKRAGPQRIPHNVVQWLQKHYEFNNKRLDYALKPYNITVYWRTNE